jgi:hypothetical protein
MTRLSRRAEKVLTPILPGRDIEYLTRTADRGFQDLVWLDSATFHQGLRPHNLKEEHGLVYG